MLSTARAAIPPIRVIARPRGGLAVYDAGSMSPAAAERIVVLTMRSLAASFAVVGVLFIATPDGVVDTIDDVGDWFGSFSPGPDTDQRMSLGLAFAYMTVITGIALVVSTDVVRHRPLLLVLAAGKAASSLAAGAYFVWSDDVFIYLLNFLVDGGLVLVALACWSLAGVAARSATIQREARAPA
jgi:hypothetical protein